ncbi:MAG: hypothetical protein GY862_11885 [Gammaproteobacteria bacterium]|nr:hypothetical protein [Gammaproteobacteria bacterium]
MKTSILKISLLLYILLSFLDSLADNYMERRILAGSKIFRTLMAADMDIAKKIDAQGQLVLVLVYRDNPDVSQKAADTLRLKAAAIKDLPLNIKQMPLSAVNKQDKIAGVFIAQNLSRKELQRLIDYSVKHSIVLYSPFEGDVEQGVTAGLLVEARVQPYLNMAALKVARLRIKPFFIKVSKIYE